MSARRPPRLARRLVKSCLRPSEAERLLQALDEEYLQHVSRNRTPARARRWYWSQALRSIPPLWRGSVQKKRQARAALWRERGGGQLLRGAGFLVDVRHLGRMLRRTPWSAGAAVLTLALALGLGTAIYAVVEVVLLRPLPYADPQALIVVGPTPADEPGSLPRAARFSDFEVWQEVGAPVVHLEGYDPSNVTLTGLGLAERLSVTNVTPGFLDLLGASPVLGRGFDTDDVGQPLAVVSHHFWQTRLAGNPDVLGQGLVLDGRLHTVTGVLPEGFFFALNMSDVWRPLPSALTDAERNGLALRLLGRLSSAATPASAIQRIQEQAPISTTGTILRAMPLSDVVLGGSRVTLGLLAGAAALAILVAFINLAALLVVRSIDRGRELAVRSALGAGPSEALRQLLLEALVVVLLGIGGGVLLAAVITPPLGRFALEHGGLSAQSLTVSWRAVGVVAVAALGLAGLCGAYPALTATRTSGRGGLDRGATASLKQLRARRVFVAGQVGVAFVLLISLAQVGRSLLNVLDVGAGFEPAGVLKLQISLPASTYPDRETVASFYADLQRSLDRRIGPGTSALISEVPLTGDGGRAAIGIRSGEITDEVVLRNAGQGYFEVMGIPLVTGRTFDATDIPSAPVRAVITESLARRLAGSEQIEGSSIWLQRGDRTVEVVGVVGDVKHRALEEQVLGTVYLSGEQFPSAASVLVVRSPLPDAEVARAVRGAVRRLDRSVPVYRVETMDDVLARSPGVPARRILTTALAGSALLAVLLSAIGLFGVLAHDVASRSRELAVRMALGATPGRIVAVTLRKGGGIVGVGLVVGAFASLWVARVLQGVLYSVQQGDWAAAALVSAVVLSVVGALTVLPVALRAAGREPSSALRAD